MRRSDMKLIETAIKQRWEFTDEYKKGIVTEMVRIVANPKAPERSKIAAARVLAQLEAQNQADEHKQADITRAEMAGIIEQLGLVEGAETVQQSEPSGDPTSIADAAERAGVGRGAETIEAKRSSED